MDLILRVEGLGCNADSSVNACMNRSKKCRGLARDGDRDRERRLKLGDAARFGVFGESRILLCIDISDNGR